MSRQTATAFAPASVGNVAVGFDLIGHVIEGPGDRVTAVRTKEPGVIIERIEGLDLDLPLEAENNTAGGAALSLLQAAQADFGVRLVIDKGIPLGSGLGGSAASATAAVVAVNALLPKPLPTEALYPHALAGERIASGAVHGDNVGPQLLGGLVLATADRLLQLPLPEGLYATVVHPEHIIETRQARECLLKPFDLPTITAQQAALALFLCGCFQNDLELLAAGLTDLLVEPRRSQFIPGFASVKQAALDHGALGASISGAGPAVFGWFANQKGATGAATAMITAFADAGLPAQSWVSPVDAPGARLVD